MRAQADWRRRAACLGLVCLLGACGGGGGGSNDPSSDGDPLIPTPPTPGTTLYADATVLRPLADGARWTYDGSVQLSGSASPVTYQNVVTTTVEDDGSYTEQATDLGHGGPDTHVVVIADGEVVANESFTLGDEVDRPLRHLELRSPVRVGDQYTIVDLKGETGGRDLDLDGRNDKVDYAMYTRVVGAETIDVPYATGIVTVHLRTTQSSRYTLSSSGLKTDIATATTDLWYAPELGVVKRIDDYPSEFTDSGRDITTEELSAVSGLGTP